MSPAHKRDRALIIDKEVTTLDEYSHKLSKLGYETLSATCPSTAFSMIGNIRPRVILMKWDLPESSGFNFLREIQAHDVFSGIPVIVFSNNPTREAVLESAELGARDFLIEGQTSLSELGKRIKAARRRPG